MGRRWLVAALALGGCGFQAGFDGARFRCDEDEPCPAGQSCVGGFCSGGGEEDGGQSDGGSDVDVPCGTMSLLVDEFDNGPAGPRFVAFTDPDTTVGETDSELRISFAAGEESWAGYRSVERFNVAGGEVRVRVEQAGSRFTILELEGADAKAQLLVEGTVLRATILDDAGETVEREVDYLADRHRIWRIRGEGQELHFETSADEAAWELLQSFPDPFAGQDVRVVLSGSGAAGDDAIRFASINTGVTSGDYCPVGQLIDPFTAPPVQPIWYPWITGDCAIAEAGGMLDIAITGAGVSRCGIDSSHLFDLRDSQVAIGLPPVGMPGGVTTVTGLAVGPLGDDDIFAQLTRTGDSLVFQQRSGGVDETESTAHDPAEHRYVRLRGDGVQLRAETSADGTRWKAAFSGGSNAIDLARIQVTVLGGVTAGDASGESVRVDGVNAP